MMKKVLCFGDSNTWGHDPADCSQLLRRWTVMAGERLQEYEIIQDGVCGRTTRYGEHDTNGFEVFKERYIDKDCDFDLIIIMLGTNDTLNDFAVSPDETADALGLFVKECRIKYGNKKPEILLVSPIKIKERALTHELFGTLYSAKSVEDSAHFAENIESAAKREGAYFLDAALFAEASDIDGVHMTSDEHERLAGAIIEKIKMILEKQS